MSCAEQARERRDVWDGVLQNRVRDVAEVSQTQRGGGQSAKGLGATARIGLGEAGGMQRLISTINKENALGKLAALAALADG